MGEFTYFGPEPPLWLIGISLFAAQILAREVGGWVRRRVAGGDDGQAEESSDKGFILSGVLGLLALMIAFTFSLALNRYEIRRDLVVAEANAIGTAEMRVQLLASPQGADLARRLHAYARTRLRFGLASAEEKPTLARSSARQRDAMQAATIRTLLGRDSPISASVAAAINAVLDIGVEREAMLSERVPLTVLAALGAFTLLTAAILGYALTGARARQRPSTIILFALLTMAVLLILDLDRPQNGSIHISQSSMARLVAGFPSDDGRTATRDPAVK